ncbi:MAG: hypothetical protein ROO70_23005 [Labrenzia sp.]
MFFYLSKIAAFFIQPSNFLIALVVVGLVMSMGTRLQKWGAAVHLGWRTWPRHLRVFSGSKLVDPAFGRPVFKTG